MKVVLTTSTSLNNMQPSYVVKVNLRKAVPFASLPEYALSRSELCPARANKDSETIKMYHP
jgi:hypothetical protein